MNENELSTDEIKSGVTDKPFNPTSLNELVAKLDELQVDYTEWKDDPDRGPARLWQEIERGKNSLILRKSEQGEKILRVSRVFRAVAATEADGHKYEFRLIKKISNSTGEEVIPQGDEALFSLSKGLRADQKPEDVIENVMKQDLGQGTTLLKTEYFGQAKEKRAASPGSKIPWIDSEYQFETYGLNVSVPSEVLSEPIVDVAQAWTTIRQAILIAE